MPRLDYHVIECAHMEAPTFSDTVRKVDQAVARLEELQGILLQGRRNHALQQYNSSRGTVVPSSLNGSNSNYCNRDAAARASRRHAPGSVVEAGKWRSGAAPGRTGEEWRRWSTAAALAEGAVTDVRAAAKGNAAGRASSKGPKTNRKPTRGQETALSPPSSAASRITGRARRQAGDASSTASTGSSRAVVPAPPAPPKPFLVDTRPQPNRPWRFSAPVASPSPTTTATTTTTSTPAAAAASSSAATASTRRTPPLQQLPRNLSRLSSPSVPNLRPPYCSSSPASGDCCNKENEELKSPLIPPAIKTKLAKTKSPSNKPQPWFARRFSLPISPSTKSTCAALSLLSRQLPAGSSPQKPLPSLITRLPTRKKKPFQYTKSPDADTLAAAPDKTGAAMPPLPLPPALRDVVTSKKTDAALGAAQKPGHKPGHRRSLSCPRQRSLLQPLDGILNRQPVHDRREPGCLMSCSCGLASKITKPLSCELDSCAAAGRAFSGCSSSMIHSFWPPAALKRSWSFSHDRNDSNLTVTGPDFFRHFKDSAHQDNKDSSSQVYRADSFTRRACKESRKFYHV